ncbi:hypothetical protein B0H15DRAFT_797918 [Mycena belliarum]|uniref:Uncharacterized protein n=1 Tax=Mycena belliarum TaxID=1033014 RepID=A0AAD6UFL4_9AGAR|nr:hypothetical protein B0H15DRAFT_797918 [Mycena belliae]
MLEDLHHLYIKDKVAPAIADDKFDDWVRAVVEIDDGRTWDDARLGRIAAAQQAALEKGKRRAASVADESERAPRKSFKAAGSAASIKPSSTSSTASGSGLFCPPLSVEERDLLSAHEGCNKCRRFYAGHVTKSCPNNFPDPASYKPLTTADAAAAATARKAKGKVAVIMPAVNDEDDSEDDDSDSQS